MIDGMLVTFAVIVIITTLSFLWKAIDRWMDNLPEIIIVPESKAQELEQHLWGKG